MINPKDLEDMDDEELMKQFNPEFLAEFSNGKGDDDDDDTTEQSKQ